MSFSLAVSHIFVISKDMDIVDLGEYSGQHLRISSRDELIIDHPSTKSKQVFVSSDDNVPITYIFSRSNKNDDCLIYGTIKDSSPIIGETSIIVIEPYPSLSDAMRMVKEVEVHNKFLSRGARYIKYEKNNGRGKRTKAVIRLNPIIERIKQVIL